MPEPQEWDEQTGASHALFVFALILFIYCLDGNMGKSNKFQMEEKNIELRDALLAILPEILRSIIPDLPRNFDSHDVIDVLDQKFPTFYAKLKLYYKDRGEETTVDSIIAKALGRDPQGFGIEKGETKNSENINGNETPNRCWKKTSKKEEL